MTKENLYALNSAHLIQPLTPVGSASKVIMQRGEGAWLYDIDDKAYLDARAQLCCVNLGYSHEGIIDAIRSQAGELPFSALFYGISHPLAIKCAARIAALAPGDLNHVFFSSGGSEGIELALSLVRQYWSGKKPTKRKIISRYEGYHGNTAAAMTASGMDMAGMPGVPSLLPGYVHIAPPYQYRRGRDMDADAFGRKCAEELAQAIEREGADSVAAFVAEPIMGVGGYIAPPDNYWQLIREVCDNYSVLLILDEVMTGFCRTGNMFASQTYGVVPDMIVMGKGITSNYVPCGGVVFNETIFEQVKGSYLTGVTNSGHPLAMAACLAALNAYENDKICDQVGPLSNRMFSNLTAAAEQLDYIGEVSGKGLMIGIELVADPRTGEPVTGDICQQIVAKALENGLLLRARGSRLSISPPLNISPQDADLICTRLLDATASILA